MIPALLEGVDSLRLPCSWVLLIPAAAITLFGRRRPVLVVSVFVTVAIIIGWLRFSGWWFATPHGTGQVLLGLGIMGTAALAWKFDRGATDVFASVVAGIISVWAWIPCVGPELADILNNAPREPFAQIPGTIGFFLGLLIPFIIVAAIGATFPKLQEALDDRRVVTAGAVLFGIVGLLFTTTFYDNLSSALFSISTF